MPVLRVVISMAVTLYALSMVYSVLNRKREQISVAASVLFRAGLLMNLFALAIITVTNNRLPLASGGEFLVTLTAVIGVIYLIYDARGLTSGEGGVVAGITALLLMLAGPQIRAGGEPLMPALKSPWLIFHVLSAALAYGLFAVAAGLALTQILHSGTLFKKEAVHRTVAYGFALLTVSIILGAVWAEQVWGSYWSWDPKETWALLTWILYAVYLHLYRQREWEETTTNILVIAGFILLLFTFFGVNYFMGGLHSYA